MKTTVVCLFVSIAVSGLASAVPYFHTDFDEASIGDITGLNVDTPNTVGADSGTVTLDTDNLDKWGQPTLAIDCDWKENELALNEQIQEDAVEMLERVGLKDIVGFDNKHEPGFGIHEMGTARMGRDPKTSVLNGTNQIHAVPNVFVTDGACMTSNSCVNPSLTYMALTARAADHAISELKKQNL